MNEQLDHFKCADDGERYAGDHLLIEFWGASRLAEPDFIRHALEDGARAAGATILHSHYHHFGEESGVSGVTVLAESHITIHTWPEVGYAAIDVFMCGDAKPMDCLALLEKRFNPTTVSTENVRRGRLLREVRAQRVA